MNISFRPNVGLNIASMAFQRKKKAGVSPSVQKAGADIFVKRNTIPKEISEMSKTARVLDVEAKELKGKLEAKANYIVELFESNGIGTNNRASAAITKGKTDGEKDNFGKAESSKQSRFLGKYRQNSNFCKKRKNSGEGRN